MENTNLDEWGSRVRDYEVDFQGIVNNANYHHYLDEARSLFFLNREINLKEYADNGINLVLVSSHIEYKFPLKFSDSFLVKTAFIADKLLRT